MPAAKKQKKSEAEDASCTTSSETIPVNGVTWSLQFKVSGEPDAVKAEESLKKIYTLLTKVKGFNGAQRFVCKAAWDEKLFARFENVEALTAFLEGDAKKKKVDPLVKELEAVAKDGHVHSQNFVADDWSA